MPALDSLLERAAASAEWTHVVQRCAWCGRVANEHGEYVTAVAMRPETVFSDGMCPPCAAHALASLAERRARLARGAGGARPASVAA